MRERQQRKVIGIAVLVGSLGILAGNLGAEIQSAPSWAVVTTPAFVGSVLMHVASTIGTLVAGQLLPTNKRLKP